MAGNAVPIGQAWKSVMDYTPVVISTNEEPWLSDLVRRSAERFRRLNGREVFIVTDEVLARSPRAAALAHPRLAKTLIWELIDSNVDRIVYYDRDILPVAPLGDLPDCLFAAAPDRPVGLDVAKRHWPFFKRSNFYFNSGFFVARRESRPVFDMVYALQSDDMDCLGCYDQTLFNIVSQSMLDVVQLPVEYSYPIADARVPCEHPKMVHCFGTRRKYTLLRYLLDELEGM